MKYFNWNDIKLKYKKFDKTSKWNLIKKSLYVNFIKTNLFEIWLKILYVNLMNIKNEIWLEKKLLEFYLKWN